VKKYLSSLLLSPVASAAGGPWPFPGWRLLLLIILLILFALVLARFLGRPPQSCPREAAGNP